MSKLTSSDGTSIAYNRRGSGPAVILVGGGLVDPATGRAGRAENAPLAAELAGHFTVYNYDRRGRAESGDTLPYAVEREIEDIEALIGDAGGSAHLYGLSSGGALALEAAAAGLPVDSVAVYEVPYSVGEYASQSWRDYSEALGTVLAEGRRGDAVELFMRLAGASEDDIVGEGLSDVARAGGDRAHPGLRRGLLGRWPPADRASCHDHSAGPRVHGWRQRFLRAGGGCGRRKRSSR